VRIQVGGIRAERAGPQHRWGAPSKRYGRGQAWGGAGGLLRSTGRAYGIP